MSARRDLLDFLTSRDARRPCPACGRDHWDSHDHPLALPRMPGGVEEAEPFEVIPLVCRNCGFVRLHSAHVLSDPRQGNMGS